MTTATIEQTQNQEQAEAQVAGLARLGKLLNHTTDFPELLDRHIQERSELEQDNALSIEVERTVRIVLCTGGPHCEIRWPETGVPSIVCYGWFGADRYERNLNDEEVDGLTHAYGDWDTLVSIES
jgi:hypothetical protein